MKRTVLIAAAIVMPAILVPLGYRTSIAHNRGASVVGTRSFQANAGEAQIATGRVTEEFHQSHPLTPDGRVSIENTNGAVRIGVWERNEVKIDAVKSANNPQRLAEANIEVTNALENIIIKTKYPEIDDNTGERRKGSRDDRATVEYVLTIPRKARVDTAQLVNGPLELEGVEGDVQAACVNGSLTARGLKGDVKLSNVNGRVEVAIASLIDSKAVTLNSVNGNIVLTIPTNANADLRANTLHGAITNDFGLPVNNRETVGHDLSGQLGSGGTRVHLSNVNGQIAIKRGS